MEIGLDETYFGGRRKGKRGRGGVAGKIHVFGIYERNGTVRVEVVKDVIAESLLNMTIKAVRQGSIVYTDKFRSYDALMSCGYRLQVLCALQMPGNSETTSCKPFQCCMTCDAI